MQANKLLKTIALTAGLSLMGSTMANQATEELQRISEQTAVLEAQLKQLELEEKIAKIKQEASNRANILTTTTTATKPRFATTVDPLMDMGLPSVIQVEGVKGSLEAILAYPGNIRQRVKEGDVISGLSVTKLSVNEVVLTNVKSKQTHRLSFSTNAVTKDPSGSPASPLPTGSPGGTMPNYR